MPIAIEKISVPEDVFADEYACMRKDKNNMSYWFPKIEKIESKGEIGVPDTTIIPVPDNICNCFWCYDGPKAKTFQDEVYAWVKAEVIPRTKHRGVIFLKNGTFSNKFNFQACTPYNDAIEITAALLDINYHSLILNAGGLTEVVVRDRLNNGVAAYQIYNGMPLVPEARVFYDFDARKVLYAVNYWDYDHCAEQISYNVTDGLVYRTAYPEIEMFFNENKAKVCEMVERNMPDVDLAGKWSVDLMYDSNFSKWFLIDMAVAEQSAYWNPELI